MRSGRPSLLAFALCLVAPAAAGAPPAAKPADVSQKGHFAGHTYSNDLLGLRYDTPDGFFANGDLPNYLPAGSTPLLIADQHTGRPLRNRILLIADDAGKYDSSLTVQEYVSKVVRSMLGLPRHGMRRGSHSVEIGGARYYRADYMETFNGGALYKSFVCIKRNGFFVSWTFVSSSEQELGQMSDSLRTVSFHDPREK